MKPLPIIVPNFTPHWDLTIPILDYHADTTSQSSTGLKSILESPRAYIRARNEPFKQTDTLRFGNAVHAAVLEPDVFEKKLVLQPEFKGVGMRKDKETWLKSLAPDAIVLKSAEYEELQYMRESVNDNRIARVLLKHGVAEMSGFYADPVTGIKCRIRPDLFIENGMTFVDLKTTTDCSKDAFSRSIYDYGYAFQAAMYVNGIELITGKQVKNMYFIALENREPFDCVVYRADEFMLQKGAHDYRVALDRLSECLKSEKWLGRQEVLKEVETIGLPAWATR